MRNETILTEATWGLGNVVDAFFARGSSWRISLAAASFVCRLDSALLIYLSTNFIFEKNKKKRAYYLSWFKRYFVTAILFICPVVIIEPFIIVFGLMMIPFFLIKYILWQAK